MRAWTLFAAGTPPRQIRRIVGLTAAQLHRLYSEGLPASGTRKEPLVGFEQRLAEEQAAIRSEAVAAGKAISHVGVEALDRTMRNANTAQVLIDQIFRLTADRMEWAASLPVEERPSIASLLPDADTTRVLRELRQIGRTSRDAALVYRLIYDDPVAVHPATRSALNIAGKTAGQAALPGAGKDTLPAALAFLDGVAGEGAGQALLEDMANELLRWTPEQRKHYADTGEEPDPADVPDPGNAIDVTAT